MMYSPSAARPLFLSLVFTCQGKQLAERMSIYVKVWLKMNQEVRNANIYAWLPAMLSHEWLGALNGCLSGGKHITNGALSVLTGPEVAWQERGSRG